MIVSRYLTLPVRIGGSVSTVKIEQMSHEGAEVLLGAELESLDDVVKFLLAHDVEAVAADVDVPSSDPIELVATLFERRRNA
jgi:hypothetical protein